MSREDYARDFGPFDGKIWINCSHQGALPRVAVEQAMEAISWKVAPFHLTTERFGQVPARLKKALGQLINCPAEDVILANSASYGLHLMANGLPFRPGDEVILVENDFPSDILPWLALEKKGVRIKFLKPRQHVPTLDELQAQVSVSTRLFCTTWVHSFSGWTVDLEALGAFCREKGILFFLNCSQALGARKLDVSTAPIDAVTSVGFKYLCGPYGTGFCWIRPEVRETLEYNQAYWLARQTADDLQKESNDFKAPPDLGAKAYDIFGTANFFNFKPWTASVEYILDKGVENICQYDSGLVSQLTDGLDPGKYEFISPRKGPARSNLVVISHSSKSRNNEIYEKLREKGIYIAQRRGNLRLSPHLYNTGDQIEQAIEILNSF